MFLAARMSKVSIALLNIMVNKGRGEVLYTAHEFIALYDVKNNITNAKVVRLHRYQKLTKRNT
jgi:F-type H+-transporting ATPase subunit delta